MKIAFSDNQKNELGRLGISAVALFGSQAQGTETENSDLDIGILVNDTKILFNSEARKNLYDALYDLFSPLAGKLTDIDIVFLQTAPAELQAHVMKYGQLLFEGKANIFSNYKAHVMLLYADFAPLRKLFHQGVLSKINPRT